MFYVVVDFVIYLFIDLCDLLCEKGQVGGESGMQRLRLALRSLLDKVCYTSYVCV